MVDRAEANWALPTRKIVTEEALEKALAAEEEISPREHRARHAWFDRRRNAVLMALADGRIFGAERSLIPSLQDASLRQLGGLHATEDGAFLVVEELDLHINVDGLVTRLMEDSPVAIRHAGARLAGQSTSVAKAKASARNGRLGGRPRKEAKTVSAT